MKEWARTRYEKAFTIVELAVVITVIAILAGIVIVGYGTWREMIATDEVKNDLKAAASAMENARNFSSGYPANVPSTFSASENVTLTYARGDATSFCLNATNKRVPSVAYYYDSSSKKEPQEGSCSGGLTTNLVSNPRPTSASFYNPSLETVGQTSFLKNSAGEEIVRSTRVATSAYALYVGRSAGGIVTAQEGETHTVLYKLLSPISTTVTAQIGYGTSSSIIPVGQTITLSANVVRTVRHTFTVPAGYDGQPLFIKILWGTNVGAVGDYFDTWNVMWVRGTYTDGYADGSSAGWHWHGAVNASTSSGVAPS